MAVSDRAGATAGTFACRWNYHIKRGQSSLMLIPLAGGASRGDDRKLDCLGTQYCIGPRRAGKSLSTNTNGLKISI